MADNREVRIGGCRLTLVQGDITEQTTDAIVNAANSALQLGAGVAGAIRSKGGPTIQQECNRIGGTPVGTAVITGGGQLPARYVIHAVGPHGGEAEAALKLAGAVRSSLRLAEQHHLKSISLPAISTGIFGFPLADAARILLHESLQCAAATSLEEIRFCLFSAADLAAFSSELDRQTAARRG